MQHFIYLLTYASLGGIIPCLIWLVFWLRETSRNPEPLRVLMACFVAGMITTLDVFPFESLATVLFKENTLAWITLSAFIEEIAKFVACYLVVLRTKYDRTPLDTVIYMMTVALGFSALENTLFILKSLSSGGIFEGVITGNLRFMGASLLHTLASATIGIFLAFAFYKTPRKKEEYAIAGIILAGALHTLFNFFIMSENSMQTFVVLGTIWLLVMALIVVMEKIKTITLKNI
jgi:RsiW-degrading membrane proteinase PrsW (M82 family)